jgi:tetratricopeptide (TPR) repeat protein
VQPTTAPGAGRWIALALALAFATAVIGAGVWALSPRRTQWASDVKARLEEVEAGRDARDAERAARRQVVRADAIAALATLAQATTDPDELARLRGAAQVLERLSAEHLAPPGAPRPLHANQPLFDLLPPPDHADLEAVLTDKLAIMERVVAERPDEADAAAYLAYLRLHRGDQAGATAAANQALRLQPGLWLGWVVRGQARLAGGDLQGAERDLLLGDALCPRDPSWALLARADLAEARGDLARARDLCQEALPLVTRRYGHADALKQRVARLDAASAR